MWLWFVSDAISLRWMFVNIWDASSKAPGRAQRDIWGAATSVLCCEYCPILLVYKSFVHEFKSGVEERDYDIFMCNCEEICYFLCQGLDFHTWVVAEYVCVCVWITQWIKQPLSFGFFFFAWPVNQASRLCKHLVCILFTYLPICWRSWK